VTRAELIAAAEHWFGDADAAKTGSITPDQLTSVLNALFPAPQRHRAAVAHRRWRRSGRWRRRSWWWCSWCGGVRHGHCDSMSAALDRDESGTARQGLRETREAA
jgi:hypothetical protein